jgi:hypothetical protein
LLRRPEGERCTDVTMCETPAPTPLPGLEGLRLDLGAILA